MTGHCRETKRWVCGTFYKQAYGNCPPPPHLDEVGDAVLEAGDELERKSQRVDELRRVGAGLEQGGEHLGHEGEHGGAERLDHAVHNGEQAAPHAAMAREGPRDAHRHLHRACGEERSR